MSRIVSVYSYKISVRHAENISTALHIGNFNLTVVLVAYQENQRISNDNGIDIIFNVNICLEYVVPVFTASNSSVKLSVRLVKLM